MIENIDVFKQNHVKISIGGKVIQVDPFESDSSPKNADYIFITHDHFDHFSKIDIEKNACKSTVLFVPETMLSEAISLEGTVGRIVPVKPGQKYLTYGLEFETVPAYNIIKPFHPKSAGWVGYIFSIDNQKIYIAGDTDATNEAYAVKCDIAIVPVGGTYTMDFKQAAKLVNEIKPKIAVPVHYGSVVGKAKDGDEFASLVDNSIQVVKKIKF